MIFFLQVFLLTVVFGLWHGLFVMPVLLSILGPAETHHQDSQTPPSLPSSLSDLKGSSVTSSSTSTIATLAPSNSSSRTSVHMNSKKNIHHNPDFFF
jgi:hypothetical protein